MEHDRSFPAKWVKWHELWSASIKQNRRAVYGYAGALGCWALAAYIFIVTPLTLPFLVIMGMLAFLGGVGWKDAKFQRWRYSIDDGQTSGVYKPRWHRMGGYDIRPPTDVIKSTGIIDKPPWVEKGYEYTIRTDKHSDNFSG